MLRKLLLLTIAVLLLWNVVVNDATAIGAIIPIAHTSHGMTDSRQHSDSTIEVAFAGTERVQTGSALTFMPSASSANKLALIRNTFQSLPAVPLQTRYSLGSLPLRI